MQRQLRTGVRAIGRLHSPARLRPQLVQLRCAIEPDTHSSLPCCRRRRRRKTREEVCKELVRDAEVAVQRRSLFESKPHVMLSCAAHDFVRTAVREPPEPVPHPEAVRESAEVPLVPGRPSPSKAEAYVLWEEGERVDGVLKPAPRPDGLAKPVERACAFRDLGREFVGAHLYVAFGEREDVEDCHRAFDPYCSCVRFRDAIRRRSDVVALGEVAVLDRCDERSSGLVLRAIGELAPVKVLRVKPETSTVPARRGGRGRQRAEIVRDV